MNSSSLSSSRKTIASDCASRTSSTMTASETATRKRMLGWRSDMRQFVAEAVNIGHFKSAADGLADGVQDAAQVVA